MQVMIHVLVMIHVFCLTLDAGLQTTSGCFVGGLIIGGYANPSFPHTYMHLHTGARVMWGGNLLKDHSIPACYGAWEPTAVYVPLEVRAFHTDREKSQRAWIMCAQVGQVNPLGPSHSFDRHTSTAGRWQEMLKPEHFDLVTTEIFGPFYVYTTYRDQDLPMGALFPAGDCVCVLSYNSVMGGCCVCVCVN